MLNEANTIPSEDVINEELANTPPEYEPVPPNDDDYDWESGPESENGDNQEEGEVQ